MKLKTEDDIFIGKTYLITPKKTYLTILSISSGS